MARFLAVTLLALINVSWISLLMSPDPDANLPACCRRDGKHHCMLTSMETSSGPAVANAPCPNFPGLRAVPARTKTRITAAPGQAFFARLASHPAAQAQTEALYRISYSRTAQKRGPPPILPEVL